MAAFTDQRLGRLTLISDLLRRLPDTRCEEPKLDWKPLGEPPAKERFTVLKPIPDYPVPEGGED